MVIEECWNNVKEKREPIFVGFFFFNREHNRKLEIPMNHRFVESTIRISSCTDLQDNRAFHKWNKKGKNLFLTRTKIEKRFRRNFSNRMSVTCIILKIYHRKLIAIDQQQPHNCVSTIKGRNWDTRTSSRNYLVNVNSLPDHKSIN